MMLSALVDYVLRGQGILYLDVMMRNIDAAQSYLFDDFTASFLVHPNLGADGYEIFHGWMPCDVDATLPTEETYKGTGGFYWSSSIDTNNLAQACLLNFGTNNNIKIHTFTRSNHSRRSQLVSPQCLSQKF